MNPSDARKQQLDDLREVLSAPAGRRFVWRLLDEARIFAPCYTGNGHTNYNEGRREFALPFFHDAVSVRPGFFVEMAKESEAAKDKPNSKGEYEP